MSDLRTLTPDDQARILGKLRQCKWITGAELTGRTDQVIADVEAKFIRLADVDFVWDTLEFYGIE